ncbi:MAG: glycosyltransferase family 4 protein [Acidihalobacter sp.]|uniref:glycosyltransferase family 4 protein n=1 Tax=Acidihalobacter sp. TaxID=1872108 RepID=UPI00307F2C7C
MTASAERPVALVITRNLPPLIGGMERLVWHIVDELRADYRVHVIGPGGCARHLPADVNATEIPLKPMFRYLLRTKLAAIGQALRLRPTLVFAGSGLTAPFAWLAARLTGARCISYLHGLDIEARHPIYRLLWRPFQRRCDRVLVNSHFTQQLAIEAGIDSERIAILHPGVALPDTSQADKLGTEFRARHALGDAPLMLYVGRITTRKGLAAFVQNILPIIVDRHPTAKVIVIGDEPTQALHHQTGERQRIQQALTDKKLQDKLLFLHDVDDASLQAAYFAADVLIFPVQDLPNDHEGFGMVAIEAAAHGLPTVAFAVGGVVDAIKNRHSGNLVSPGDMAAFAQNVIALLAVTPPERSAWANTARTFAAKFAWPNFGRRLIHLCQRSEVESP